MEDRTPADLPEAEVGLDPCLAPDPGLAPPARTETISYGIFAIAISCWC